MKTFITFKLNTIRRAAFLSICVLMISNLYSQNIDTMLTESWENASWVQDVRTLNTYDDNNYLIHTLSQTWDTGLNSWTNAIQWNLTNNPNGTVNQIIGQVWSAGSWDDSSRTTYTYTAFNKQLTSVSEIWTGTAWMPINKQTNTYDGSEYLTNTLLQSWDFISSSWQNSSQSNYTNNANGTVNQVIDQSWNQGTSSWDNTEKTNYTYNAAEGVLTAISQIWTGSWVNDSKITNTYNGTNHITNSLSQDWDGSLWVNNGQDNYTYNGNDSIYQIVSQVWETGAWVNEYRITFTYTPLAVEHFDYQKSVTAYPNPARDFIMIKPITAFSDWNYVISDSKGNTFQTGILKDEETTIDIHALASGVYFIQIGKSKHQVLKIIKD